MTVPKSDIMQETDTHYLLPVMRSLQGGKVMYVSQLLMRDIPTIIPAIEESDNVEKRCQRLVNKNRAKKITRYIVDNAGTYTIPALTISIIPVSNHRISFSPFVENGWIGTLAIPKSSHILINDGQHRRLGIEYALIENREIGYSTVPLTIYAPIGYGECRQIFTDINLNGVKPSGSINTLYDQRDIWSKISVDVVNQSSLLKNKIEFEKNVVSKNSHSFFPLTAIKTACQYLLPLGADIKEKGDKQEKQIDDRVKHLTIIFDAIGEHIDPFPTLKDRPHDAPYFRGELISMSVVILEALAIYIHEYLRIHRTTNDNLKEGVTIALKILKDVDWTRNAPEWEGRCIHLGRIQKNKKAVQLTAGYFMYQANIEPPLHIAELEAQLKKVKDL